MNKVRGGEFEGDVNMKRNYSVFGLCVNFV